MKRKSIQHGILRLLLLPAMLGGVADATAQARYLFTSIPSKGLKPETATQSRLIRQIAARSTTMSLTLIQVDVKLLRRCSARVFLQTERKLTFHDNRLHCGERAFTPDAIPTASGEGALVIRRGKVIGSIHAGTDVYRIEPVGGRVHTLIKVDTSRSAPEDEPVLRGNEYRGSSDSPPSANASKAAKLVAIDALVAYTPAAACATKDIVQLICTAAMDANRSYQNSNISIRLNLVDVFELVYSEGSKPFEAIVDDFSRDSAVAARRNKSGADVSILIVDSSASCAPGGRPNCHGQALALMANDATAFAVVHYDHATGPDYTFAHEVGHLQGATHEVDGPRGHFRPYGHGFQNAANPPLWRTIMAYDCANNPCQRLPYWSNPQITAPWPYSGAMGTGATNDNARVLNETASTVASFRPSSRPNLCGSMHLIRPARCHRPGHASAWTMRRSLAATKRAVENE